MKKRVICLCVPALLTLSGCSMFQSPEQRAENALETVTLASSDQQQTYVDDYIGMERIGVMVLSPGKASPQEHIAVAKELLRESADYKQARVELGKAIYQDNDNREALELYNQISADLPVFALKNGFDLNADRVVYLAKAGDDLEKVVKRFYGSNEFFAFVMRINQLNSTALAGGEELWIPAKLTPARKRVRSAPAPEPKLSPKPTVTEPVSTAAQSDAVDVDTNTAEVVANPSMAVSQDEVNGSQPAIDEVEQNTDQAGEPDRLASPNTSQTSPVMSAKREVSKEEIKGLSEYRKGSPKAAYSLLGSVSNLTEQGREALSELKTQLIEQPYAQGLHYYQEQKLALAIEQFDQVLSVDPNHSQANVYRARCQQLLERLQTIQ